MERLKRVRVVLVETSHPGNIGAVARAMWTMGLERLYLVQPKRFPCAEATARAAGADELLYSASVCQSLEEAIADCGWVVGTTLRPRHLDWPRLDPRSCAARLVGEAHSTDTALVFGREHSGLSNQELEQCHAVASIPSNPDFPSLNLAGAVQIFAWEIRCALPDLAPADSNWESASTAASPPATAEELEGLYSHLERALADIGYYDPDAPKLLMRRLRRMFNRIQPDRSELNILRGILAAAQRATRGANKR